MQLLDSNLPIDIRINPGQILQHGAQYSMFSSSEASNTDTRYLVGKKIMPAKAINSESSFTSDNNSVTSEDKPTCESALLQLEKYILCLSLIRHQDMYSFDF